MKKDWAEDQIITNVEIHLGFWDRLKVLCGRVVRVQVRCDVEHAPGKVWSISTAHVDRFFSRYFRDRGAEVVESPPDHTAYA